MRAQPLCSQQWRGWQWGRQVPQALPPQGGGLCCPGLPPGLPQWAGWAVAVNHTLHGAARGVGMSEKSEFEGYFCSRMNQESGSERIGEASAACGVRTQHCSKRRSGAEVPNSSSSAIPKQSTAPQEGSQAQGHFHCTQELSMGKTEGFYWAVPSAQAEGCLHWSAPCGPQILVLKPFVPILFPCTLVPTPFTSTLVPSPLFPAPFLHPCPQALVPIPLFLYPCPHTPCPQALVPRRTRQQQLGMMSSAALHEEQEQRMWLSAASH